MADNKKYYYMRIKENFFETDEILVLESMQDGYLYSNILLKLYLRSLKDNGKLMFNGRIPYNAQMIATITRQQVGTVEKALSIFKEMGLIEILDNGAIYMLDIQKYIGKSSTEADRKREYRSAIESQKTAAIGQGEDKCPDKPTPEIELEIDIYKYNVQIRDEFEELWKLYPNKKGKTNAFKSYERECKKKKNPAKFEEVKKGLIAYCEYIKATNTEMRFVKNGSTWFNQRCWEDDYTIQNGKDSQTNKKAQPEYELL